MSVLGAISRKDKGTGAVLPNLQTSPERTGFFENIGAGFTQSVAGPHSTRNARAIYESRQYDQIIAALNAEGERATDMVDIGVKADSPFYRPVPGAQVQPNGRVLVPVQRSFTNPFSEGPSLTRNVNPLANFYLGGDAKEIGQIWDAVKRARGRKKDFLKDFPDPSAIDAAATRQRQADQQRAGEVTSRATLGGQVGQFIGGMAGSIASGDPENFVGGWSGPAGKSMARTVVNRAVEGAAANAAAGVVAVPGQASDSQSLGQTMTIGDMVKSVGQNAAAGALFGTAHVLVPKAAGVAARGVGSVTSKALDLAAQHMPDVIRNPVVAASIRAGTVKDRQLLYEFQRAHSPYSAVDTSTPTEKAAAHVLTQEVETKEQSPLQPAAEGAHADRLTAVAKALGVDLTPPETPTTAPIVTPTVRDRSANAMAPTRPASYAEAVSHAEGTGKNPESSADGYFQFTKKTWREYAPRVADTAGMSDDQVLALRHNKDIAGHAEQLFRADNGKYLRDHGEEDSPGNLSLAHFLGKADAIHALKAERLDPNTPIQNVIDRRSYAANESTVFTKHQTVGDVIAWAHKRIGAAVDHPPARPDAVPSEGFDYSSPVPYAVETLRPEELPPTSAEAPTDEPWNHVSSQHLLVWESEDGTRSLIDGGKRLAHARSLYPEDQSIRLPTVVLRERDGVSEEMAMLVGKLKNVNLQTVPLEEAAGTLADIPEIAGALRSPQFRREIAAIAQLPYEDFGKVVNGDIPALAKHEGSWVVVDRKTGKSVMETPNLTTAASVNQGKYEVLTAHQWLARYNTAVAEAGGVEPSVRHLKKLVGTSKEIAHAKELVTAGNGDSRSAGEPPSREGRDFATEASNADVPSGRQPSLFDQAIAARDQAEPFSDPVSQEANQQAALIEHDLRQDAGLPKETTPEDEKGRKGKKGLKPISAPEPSSLFDLPETGFRLSEEGNTVSIKDALDQADADEAAAKALRDCL